MTRRELRRELRRLRDDAEDAKALAWRLLPLAQDNAQTHDIAMLLDRYTGRLTSALNDLLGEVRGAGGDGQMALGV